MMQLSSHLQLVHFNFTKCPFADGSEFLVSDIIMSYRRVKEKRQQTQFKCSRFSREQTEVSKGVECLTI